MDKKDNLKHMIQYNQEAVKKLLDDITEEESLNPTRGLVNHIKWQTGHLAYSVDFMIKIMGGEMSLPEEWIQPYKGGVELPEDDSVFPKFEEIRGKLYELYDKINGMFDNVTDEFLDEVAELSEGWKEVRLHALNFFCTHEFYHAGHITIIRKNLGRERPFG